MGIPTGTKEASEEEASRSGITFYAAFLISYHLEINPDIIATPVEHSSIMCLKALNGKQIPLPQRTEDIKTQSILEGLCKSHCHD